MTATTLVLMLGPLLLIRAIWGRVATGQWLESAPALGLRGGKLHLLRFAGDGVGRSLACLWQVMTGELAWVGPRPIPPSRRRQLRAEDLARFDVPPGLVSVASVRSRMGLAHDGHRHLDREMALSWRRRDSLALLAKSALAACLGGASRDASSLRSARRSGGRGFMLFGVDMDDRSMPAALDELMHSAERKQAMRIAFVNPDCLNKAFKDPQYRGALHSADRVYADGIGIRIAARWRREPLADNVNGTDLFPRLCERAAERNLGLFLLGARPGVAEATAREMQARFPSLRIAGTQHGYFAEDETEEICRRIADSGAHFVLVAFGAPRQELWLERHHRQLGSPVVMGVGGLFDFYSGRIQRAPQAWRELGLEWLFRLIQEPGRMWRRYVVGNPLFLWRVLFSPNPSTGNDPVRLDPTQRHFNRVHSKQA